jgi:hypothetical protein
LSFDCGGIPGSYAMLEAVAIPTTRTMPKPNDFPQIPFE